MECHFSDAFFIPSRHSGGSNLILGTVHVSQDSILVHIFALVQPTCDCNFSAQSCKPFGTINNYLDWQRHHFPRCYRGTIPHIQAFDLSAPFEVGWYLEGKETSRFRGALLARPPPLSFSAPFTRGLGWKTLMPTPRCFATCEAFNRNKRMTGQG